MSAPTDSSVQRAPLEGVRVLDLTRVLAGPWCTQLLGDLGADVVKVEAPGTGDDSRQFGQALPGDGPGRDSGFFLACNRNKRSITVDLNTASGAALIARLAAESDVLVENFKAGGLRRFGLDAASLMPANPRLIYCSVTGFGQDGPYAKRPAYDFIMQAMAGLMSSCGQPEGAPGGMPMRTGIPTTDLVAGYQATVAILGALIQRGISGQGQFIDAAMLDSSVCFNSTLAQAYLITGQPVTRQGNNNPIASPSGVFQTADGWMVVAAGNDRQFVQLCGVLGATDLPSDTRFASNMMRVQNRQALHALIEPVLQSQTTDHWLPRLSDVQVPCTRINNMAQTFADPQVQHRNLVAEVQHGSGAPLKLLRSCLNMSAHRAPLRAPPQLGADNAAVLSEWLGLDTAAVQSLFAAGAMGAPGKPADTAP